MCMGNYPQLLSIESPHIVTNYWKRVLRHMAEPLIPFDLYGIFEQVGAVTNSRGSISVNSQQQVDQVMLLNLKFLLNQLPLLNFNTLKFHVEFFTEVIEHVESNKMNEYNLAVTVGPNIFRPRRIMPSDIAKVGIFYDLLIRMIRNHQVLFDRSLSCEALIESWNMSDEVIGNIR